MSYSDRAADYYIKFYHKRQLIDKKLSGVYPFRVLKKSRIYLTQAEWVKLMTRGAGASADSKGRMRLHKISSTRTRGCYVFEFASGSTIVLHYLFSSSI